MFHFGQGLTIPFSSTLWGWESEKKRIWDRKTERHRKTNRQADRQQDRKSARIQESWVNEKRENIRVIKAADVTVVGSQNSLLHIWALKYTWLRMTSLRLFYCFLSSYILTVKSSVPWRKWNMYYFVTRRRMVNKQNIIIFTVFILS